MGMQIIRLGLAGLGFLMRTVSVFVSPPNREAPSDKKGVLAERSPRASIL
jgi:hypothetical protein